MFKYLTNNIIRVKKLFKRENLKTIVVYYGSGKRCSLYKVG